jgi:excisionase family DNA binding protein
MANPARIPIPSDPMLLTVEEAAQRLRVGRTTLYALVKAGAIRPVHIGRATRFTAAELARFVRALERPAPRRRPRGPYQDGLFEVAGCPRPPIRPQALA